MSAWDSLQGGGGIIHFQVSWGHPQISIVFVMTLHAYALSKIANHPVIYQSVQLLFI